MKDAEIHGRDMLFCGGKTTENAKQFIAAYSKIQDARVFTMIFDWHRGLLLYEVVHDERDAPSRRIIINWVGGTKGVARTAGKYFIVRPGQNWDSEERAFVDCVQIADEVEIPEWKSSGKIDALLSLMDAPETPLSLEPLGLSGSSSSTEPK